MTCMGWHESRWKASIMDDWTMSNVFLSTFLAVGMSSRTYQARAGLLETDIIKYLH